MTPLQLIKLYSWQLPPPAEQIQKIIVEDLKLPVTAEIMQMDDPWYIPSDALIRSDLGESPTQLRSYLLP